MDALKEEEEKYFLSTNKKFRNNHHDHHKNHNLDYVKLSPTYFFVKFFLFNNEKIKYSHRLDNIFF
jgi:hypothetical protein